MPIGIQDYYILVHKITYILSSNLTSSDEQEKRRQQKTTEEKRDSTQYKTKQSQNSSTPTIMSKK